MPASLVPIRHSLDELHNLPTYSAQRMTDSGVGRKKLNADDYRRLLDKFNSITVEKSDAALTRRNIVRIQGKWEKFCEIVGKKDPPTAIFECTKGDCMGFMTWLCENYPIQGRQQKYESIRVAWRDFKMFFARCTGYRMNVNATSEVSNFLAGTLKKRYKLDTSVKPKPVIGVDDLLLLLTHIWARDDSVMPDEEQRVQLATILLFAAYTGARPAEYVDASLSNRDKEKIKNASWRKMTPWDNPNDSDYDDLEFDELERVKSLCWEDVELRLVSIGEGPPVLAMWVSHTRHKGVDRNPLPTIFCFTQEQEPIFDPIAHLIALALQRDAFEADNLKSMSDICKIVVPSRLKSIHLKWKVDMAKKPLFCQAVRTPNGLKTDPRKPLRYPTFHHYIQRLGLKVGFQDDVTSYCFRRGTGNAVDGSASKAIRDRVMRHNPEAKTFQKYLNPKLNFSVQAAMLERPSDKALQKAMSHMSLTRDPCAPAFAPKDYVEALPPDDGLLQKQKEREALSAQLKMEFGAIKHADAAARKRYSKLCSSINAAKTRRQKQADRDYRKSYFNDIHTAEIERQRENFKETPYVEPAVDHQLRERKDVQDIMCNISKFSIADEREQRILAVDALRALCSRREKWRPMQRQATAGNKENSGSKAAVTSAHMDLDQKSIVDPFPMLLDPRQCPVCIGDEGLSHQQRTYHFYNIWNMWDHAETHFRDFPSNKPYLCRHPKCNGELLNNTTHFKNHCETQHNCRLRA